MMLSRPIRAARYPSVLTLGDGATDNLTRFVVYFATHPVHEQYLGYEKSMAASGLRFHAPGPAWMGDPNVVGWADDAERFTPYHIAVLERCFDRISLFDHRQKWEGGEETNSRMLSYAANLLWFVGSSIPDFAFTQLTLLKPEEVKDFIPGLTMGNAREYLFNWSRSLHFFGGFTDSDSSFREMLAHMSLPKLPLQGLHVLNRWRATKYGWVVRDYPIVTRIPLPRTNRTQYEDWLRRAEDETDRVLPDSSVILAGDRGFFRKPQEAVMFRLAVESS